ncbi:MAG: hypothetical protein ACOX2G_09745 [Bacillota bacterium]
MPKRIIGVAVLAICFLVLSASAVDQLTPFLRENYTPLDIDALDLSLMAEDLAESEVILSGAEFHGTKATYQLQSRLTIALHRQAGVRYLLLGIGHATGQLYNTYLQTGDPDLLDLIQSEIRFTSASCHEHRLAWEELSQYNLSLAPEDRLTVIGIDLEYQPHTAAYYLSSLSSDKDLVPAPDSYLGTPHALDQYVTALELDLARRETKYREALGENYEEYVLVVKNLRDTVTANCSDDFYAIREGMMYQNFLRALTSHPRGKYFGQFSMDHIYQRQAGPSILEGSHRLAMYLNRDDSPVQGKVLSIAAMYIDSVFRFNYGRYYTADLKQDFFIDELAFLNLTDENAYTLFRLEGEDSPFERAPFTIRKPYGGTTTDYYQYLLAIRSGPTSSNKR